MSELFLPHQTRESKSVATDRLRRENRWLEASVFKDQAIKRLRAEGRPKTEASEAAWDEMLAKFAPLPMARTEPVNALDLSTADDSLIDRLAAIELDWARDVKWCYANLEHPRVRLESAPSLGAWGLLKTARSDRQKFIREILQPVLESHREAQPEPPHDPGIAEIEKMLAAYEV